eukprot:TRINITY_DN60251_c0_g1_i1.p1 TRINITY_DN60251_c0_g1~~TRINITY_DN60251_c0_g1_i1.p1  ORF type:complete len:604 (+),score=218.56 TRINITY_DN60251_c0_g1_i1:90-1814(+)
MATAPARAAVAASAAEAARLEKEASQLTAWLQHAEEDYIAALESRDKDTVRRLEKEIEEVTAKRDSCVTVSSRMRREEAARQRCSQLVMLVWVSTFSQPFEIGEVAVIGHRSADANRQRGVTGVLLFSLTAGQFFQVLEGDADVVDKLYATIAADKRHRDVTLLRRQLVDARRFPQWPMYTLNLADHDKAEQPLQAVLAVIAQHALVADACMQSAMRQALVRGGNPLFMQPKRTKVITMMVSLHIPTLLIDSDCSARVVADTLGCYVDTCARCVTTHGGSLVRASGARVHAQWQYSQLAKVVEAALDVVAALRELRALSNERDDGDSAQGPQMPLLAVAWPCVAIGAGSVVVMRQNTPTQVFLDAVGPSVTECEELLAAGLAANSQMVVSPLVATSLATAGQLHFQEVAAVGQVRCLSVADVAPVPANLADSATALLGELRRSGPREKDRDEPPPLTQAAEEKPSRRTDKGETREVPRELLPTGERRNFFAGSDVSSVLLTDSELRQQFEAIDVNRNGFLTKEEFRDFFDQFDAMGIYDMHDSIDTVLAEYNMLGDDRLSYDEFCVLMLKLAQR